MKIFFASAVLLLSISAWAQDDLGPQGPVVKMAPAPVVTAVQGKPSTVPLTFRVSSGYHINSNQPSRSSSSPPPQSGSHHRHRHRQNHLPRRPGHELPLRSRRKAECLYGDFKSTCKCVVAHRATRQIYRPRTLKYQACDNASCYPPKQLPVSFEVKIAKAPPAAVKIRPKVHTRTSKQEGCRRHCPSRDDPPPSAAECGE